ncbi:MULTISPECIES: anhydro-N-acetylmuramic acid kinase [unclassified Neisseria]|uniref:anhydro-N-acetylmuramic acid kinase n=1 Tax=unclassified Neisseria TaxID=2623750 RepID=UPI001072349E|nr:MULTISPECIES: anhydro-N-acetylmuramic acid kinase [unclassified Neisseria]MBF0802806.1 anhydro-N-acetylmuramic acid kinase [Neisseria sp. 19428wB4_WF04]TFU44600.1 anhydro-N-acetylmuramic acid kinase [Neisseria sp. WF04]
MNEQLYIGLMSGTSMDGVDAVLVRMDKTRWLAAESHAFLPYSDRLKNDLLNLQNIGFNELHRSAILAQELAVLYAQTAAELLQRAGIPPHNITALGCHGQTVRHAPESGYSIQLADLALLAEKSGILTVGNFRSRDLAAGGQGAPLVPAFHETVFGSANETRVVLNIGGIANISVLPPQGAAFGFDTGPGNMLMDAWVNHIWQLPFDKNGAKAVQGRVLDSLLAQWLAYPYFARPYPKSTGRELFSLPWLLPQLSDGLNPHDVLRTLLEFTVQSIHNAVTTAAPAVRNIYVCGGGIRNTALMENLNKRFTAAGVSLHSTAALNLDPQWVEAAAFGWLAAAWVNRVSGNPYHATGAHGPRILGAGYPACVL